MLRCTECSCVSDKAPGWVAYLLEDPDDGDPPCVASFCPPCAAREFDFEPRAPGPYT